MSLVFSMRTMCSPRMIRFRKSSPVSRKMSMPLMPISVLCANLAGGRSDIAPADFSSLGCSDSGRRWRIRVSSCAESVLPNMECIRLIMACTAILSYCCAVSGSIAYAPDISRYARPSCALAALLPMAGARLCR